MSEPIDIVAEARKVLADSYWCVDGWCINDESDLIILKRAIDEVERLQAQNIDFIIAAIAHEREVERLQAEIKRLQKIVAELSLLG